MPERLSGNCTVRNEAGGYRLTCEVCQETKWLQPPMPVGEFVWELRQFDKAHAHLVRRIYIAGPMTGYPESNYPAFAAAEADLRAAGYDPVSPHHNGDGDTSRSWTWYMRQALTQLVTCDAVALLPGWEMSRGAGVEHFVARALDMECKPLAAWIEPAARKARDAAS